MFHRTLDGRLPDHTHFLFGPRQVGKSTLLKTRAAIFALDLLDPATQLAYTKDPNLLERELALLPKKGLVILDEIQRVPQLLDVIQTLMERYPQLVFVMSGSSARKLRHGAANLLGGRALYRAMHPLTCDELGDRFRLDRVLSYGSLPRIYTELLERHDDLARDLLRTYVVTYLREEVQAEALVRNLQGFQRFLDIAAAQFAQQVNFTDVGRDCGVAYATVREYYTILEDTLMGIVLPPYLRSERKRMSHSPKFYFFDNGVVRALLGTLTAPPTPLEGGWLFEQWIVQELVRINDYHQKDWRLAFWRTGHGAEVDLVVERGKTILYAIECKYKRTLSTADLSGIRAFQETHPKVPCYVVAPIERAQRLGGVTALPPQAFLARMTSDHDR